MQHVECCLKNWKKLDENRSGIADLFCSMMKNHSKILIFGAGIGHDATGVFFIESSNHTVELESSHHHMRLGY